MAKRVEMDRHVYAQDGVTVLRIERAEPECGHDFCDSCGDCLACYADDTCYSSEDGEHFWVIYEGRDGPPR